MAVTTAITDIFHSFYELISSILGAAYGIISSIVNAIIGFVTGIFSLFGDVFSGLINVMGGVGKFVAGNIVILAIGGGLAFAYLRYTAQGQRTVAAGKKNI